MVNRTVFHSVARQDLIVVKLDCGQDLIVPLRMIVGLYKSDQLFVWRDRPGKVSL